jgi:hypothetical protein
MEPHGWASQRLAISPSHAAAEARAPTLLLQLLYAMVVIIGDCHGEWHRSRHSDLGKGDHECFSSFRGDDMAHDAAFVARIRNRPRDDKD